jgi:hypothetical protein
MIPFLTKGTTNCSWIATQSSFVLALNMYNVWRLCREFFVATAKHFRSGRMSFNRWCIKQSFERDLIRIWEHHYIFLSCRMMGSAVGFHRSRRVSEFLFRAVCCRGGFTKIKSVIAGALLHVSSVRDACFPHRMQENGCLFHCLPCGPDFAACLHLTAERLRIWATQPLREVHLRGAAWTDVRRKVAFVLELWGGTLFW